MAQERMCRVPCVITISRTTGEISMEYGDVPVSAVDAWCQRMARAWESIQESKGNQGEAPEGEERRENHVKV